MQGEMGDIYKDALQEISNIGLGNAATALSEMLHQRVDISVPKAIFIDFDNVFPIIGGMEEVVACVNLGVDGDVPGTVLFIFTEESTYTLIDMLMGQEPGTTTELDSMGESAVMEIGNVLTGSFINAIAEMTGLTIQTSVPMFALDMVGAILSTSLIVSGHWEDQVLLIETDFFQDQDKIKGHFFLIPEVGSLERLFEALGMPTDMQVI